MFSYKYKFLTALMALAIVLLSSNALGGPSSMERIVYKEYDHVVLSEASDWFERVLGFRVDYTCRNSEGCFVTVYMSSSMMAPYVLTAGPGAATNNLVYSLEFYPYMCPEGTRIFLYHEIFILPPMCTLAVG